MILESGSHSESLFYFPVFKYSIIALMKRGDEEYAKASFDGYLRNNYPNIMIKWEEVDKQNEPPDYFVYLGTHKVAVEVTTLMEAVELGGKKAITFLDAIKWMDEFVKEIENTAIEKSYLHGAYVIRFNRPIKNFGNLKQQIRSEILSYLHKTRSFESAPEKVVYKAPRLQKCTIAKISQNANCIYRAGPTNGKREGESNTQLTEIMNKSIHEKESKLSKVQFPKILLLLDKYLFSEFNKLAEIEIPKDFYGVFAVRDKMVFEIYASDELRNVLNLSKH